MLPVLPNQAFGEQVLVAAGMSDKWPNTSTNVPVLHLDGVATKAQRLCHFAEIELYHRAFPANAGVIGVRPVHDDEELWYEQIQDNFIYPLADTFAASPTATEGAHILNPMPCRAITPAEEEVVLLSSGESIASSEHGLNSPSYAFTGSLCELGVDPDGQKSKRSSNKKSVIIVEGARPIKQEASVATSDVASRKGMTHPQQCSLHDFVIMADSMEDLLSIGGKFKSGDAAGARSSGSVGSKEQLSGATPTSTPAEEEFEIDPIPELTRKNALKRQREESKPDPVLVAKAAQPKIRIIHPKPAPMAPFLTSTGATKKVEGAPEVTGEKVVEPGVEIPHVEGATPGPVKSAGTFERIEKVVEIEKSIEVEPNVTAEVEKPVEESAKVAEKPTEEISVEATTADKGKGAEPQHVADTGARGQGVSTFSAQQKQPSPIWPKDTLGNHYYRSYTSSRADEIHAPVWSLKQGDTFATFPTCREWFMGAFPSAELLHQKKRKQEQLYQSHVFAQANHVSTSNQITREWRTMHREHADWEYYRSRLADDAKHFEKAEAELAEQET
ncbi:hypothetical protein HanPI659440_Chr03g0114291 [Helianthus annuus]|nr:hypothetical protein HanPI659440_Chr03g0114291 [Helianthus annuus]